MKFLEESRCIFKAFGIILVHLEVDKMIQKGQLHQKTKKILKIFFLGDFFSPWT